MLHQKKVVAESHPQRKEQLSSTDTLITANALDDPSTDSAINELRFAEPVT